MPLVSMTEVLQDAQANNYAVASFNITMWDTFKAITKVAEQEKAPVILSITPKFLNFLEGPYICPSILAVASRMTVPVVLHMDHGKTTDDILNAAINGFTSVMIDGSAYPLDQNIAITKNIVDMMHKRGISVEAELGSIQWDFNRTEDLFTDPVQAEQFVQQTQVDALAVSVGNAHGVYKKAPVMQFDILQDIQQRTQIPLVLHGGSGTPDLEKMIDLGIRKINVNSNIQVAHRATMREVATQDKPKGTFCDDFTTAAVAAQSEVIRHYLRVFRSNNRA